MNRNDTAVLPMPANYDDCRIISCLKRLFTCTTKSKVETDLIVRNHIADVRAALELVNKNNTLELSHDYLAAMEESLPNVAFRYVIINRNNEPVLFAYFQMFTLTSRNFNLQKNKGFAKRIFRFFLDLKKAVVLISGNAMRNETAAFCFNEHVLSIHEALEIVASAGEKVAADEKAAALILRDVPSSAHHWFAQSGFEKPSKDMAMDMDINDQWVTLDDYINDLSRKYKTRAKKVMTSGKPLTLRNLDEGEIQRYRKELCLLYSNVADHQSFVLTKVGEDHFSSLKQLYGADFEVVGFFRGKQLVAFFTAFINPEDYELYYAGFDYELNTEYQLYFNILFSGLERAIHLKKSQLKLGRTSFDAKASLGAKPVEMPYFYKAGNIPNAVSKWFVNYFSSMEDGKWRLRHPLK